MPARSKKYFVAAIIARRRSDGTLEFIIIRSIWDGDGKLRMKFPGGMLEAIDDENSILIALRREIRAEVGLYIKPRVRPSLLHSYETKNEEEDIVRTFYLVWAGDCEGVLHKRGHRDGDTWMKRPEWKILEEIDTELHTTHRPVLQKLRRIT